MSEQYVGEIRIFGFGFPPKGWALCNGALLNIQQNTALYSLLGVQFGGDGKTTFGLPDLRGRVPVGAGPISVAPNTNYVQGKPGGSEGVTLLTTNLPSHNHSLTATTTAANTNPARTNSVYAAAAATPSTTPPTPANYYTAPTPPTALTALDPASLSPSGTGAAHPNLQPFLVQNFCIALTGIYPSRN